MKYRPDIDGLRAVAVVPVVLFHAGISQVSGGFVGVDVFFVISGYLITSLILQEIEAGRFSVATFYERRARRILPALFAVLLAASVATCALLMPNRARAFGGSLVATVLFSSNVLFWQQSGYFQAGEVKPLLHTWSLAVEEQFYIVYPIFLYLVSRFLRKRYVLALLPVFVISLAWCIWGVQAHQSMTFFLAPPRAWELLLGGLLAIPVIAPQRHRLAAELLAWSGLLLLLYSFVKLSGSLPFPGANALYPTLGAGLIIYSGSGTKTSVSSGLSAGPIVFVGLISYSLYLWHWVVFVFLRFYLGRPPAGWEIAAEIAVCVFMAALSWKYVESPFRGRSGQETFSRKWIFAGGAMGSIILAFFGAFLFLTHGLPSRFSPVVLQLNAGKDDVWVRHKECAGEICRIGDAAAVPSFVLWGDSHAGAIAPAFERIALTNKISGFVAFRSACAPLLGLRRYDQDNLQECAQFSASILSLIEKHNIRQVFMHGRWALYSEGSRYYQEEGLPALLTAHRKIEENYPEFETLFRSTIEELRRRQLNVVIVASVPEVGIDVPTALARSAVTGNPADLEPQYSDFMKRQKRAFEVLTRVAAENSIPIVYPHESFCSKVSCSIVSGSRPLYVDSNHLSVHGAMTVAPLIAPYLSSRP